MKKILLTAALLGLTGLSTQAVSIFVDTDDFTVAGSPGVLIAPSTTFTGGNFNIAAGDGDAGPNISGYVPGSGLASAIAGFTFTTTEDNISITRSYDLSLEGNSATPGSFLLVFSDVQGVIGSAFGTLNADGDIDFSVSNTGTEAFYLSTAVLTAFQREQNVPDGGATAMLIGVGILGLGALRRKA